MTNEKTFNKLFKFSQIYDEIINKGNRPIFSFEIEKSYRKITESRKQTKIYRYNQ